MTRKPQDTSAEEPDGGNLRVRPQGESRSANRPEPLNRMRRYPREAMETIDFPEFKCRMLISLGERSSRPSSFGPLLVFNDDLMKPGAYVGMHPHRNVEVLTVMISGRESHADNFERSQILDEDSVQLIGSGSGIHHAGGNMSQEQDARHLQIWIAPLIRNSPPRVQLQQFSAAQRQGAWQLQVGPSGSGAALEIDQNVLAYRGVYQRGTAHFPTGTAGFSTLAYLIRGSARVGEEALNEQDAMLFSPESPVEFEILQDGSDLWLMRLPVDACQ